MEKENVEKTKLKRSIYILEKLSKGVNPFNDEKLSDNDIVNDTRITKCFEFITLVLENINLSITDMEKLKKLQMLPFSLTEIEKEKVIFPDYPIGVVEFAKCLNEVINKDNMKEIKGVQINNGLKHMKVLHDIVNPRTGRKKTIINPDVSIKYGISIVSYEKNGITVEKIVYDEVGKKFLLDNINEILEKSNEYVRQ